MSLLCTQWTFRSRKRISAPTRVLVVDDYLIGAEALTAAFNAEGYDTRFALSGMESLEILSSWLPDVIILDINMPKYNGYDTARVIRSVVATREIPIVAFTALSVANVIEQAKSVGIDAYCQKGMTLDRIFSLVDQFVT